MGRIEGDHSQFDDLVLGIVQPRGLGIDADTDSWPGMRPAGETDVLIQIQPTQYLELAGRLERRDGDFPLKGIHRDASVVSFHVIPSTRSVRNILSRQSAATPTSSA